MGVLSCMALPDGVGVLQHCTAPSQAVARRCCISGSLLPALLPPAFQRYAG